MQPNYTPGIQPNRNQVIPNQMNYSALNSIPSYNLSNSHNGTMMRVMNSYPEDNEQKIQTFDRMTSETLNTGTLYFTDLEQETCNEVKGFTKEPSEKHFGMLMFTIMFACVTAFLLIQFGDNELIEPIFIIIGFIIQYIIYFLGTLSCCSLWPYFRNLNSYSHILNIHQQMKQSNGNILLSV